MHPALLLPELLVLIVSHLDTRDRTDKQALLHLARVSHVFTEPALDALYAHVDCFVTFLTCLPDDLWCFRTNQWRQPELHFQRQMTAPDWTSLSQKASRVRSLVVRKNLNHTAPVLSPSACAHLLASCPPSLPSLFPNLRSLNVRYFEHTPLVARLLVAPGLRTLHVKGIDVDRLLRDDVPDLAQRCPHIASFRCPFAWAGARRAHLAREQDCAVSRAVRGWRCLSGVECGPLGEGMLRHLARTQRANAKKRLEYVAAPVEARDAWLGRRFEIGATRELDLRVDSYETGARALDALFATEPARDSVDQRPSPARVESITVDLSGPTASTSSLVALTSSLSSLISPSHLTVLKLHDRRSDTRAGPHAPVVLADALAPMLSAAFTQLEELSIDFQRRPVSLSAADLAALAARHPRLRRLRIARLTHPVCITALAALAARCPDLEALSVAAEASRRSLARLVAQHQEEARTVTRASRITTLDVTHREAGSATRADVRQAAALFYRHRVFPRFASREDEWAPPHSSSVCRCVTPDRGLRARARTALV